MLSNKDLDVESGVYSMIPFVHTCIYTHTYLYTHVFVFEDAQANWGERILIILLKCPPFTGKICIFIPNSWITWFFNLMHMWFTFTKENKMPLLTNTTTKIHGFEEEWKWNDLSSYTKWGGGEYDHFYVKVTPCWLWDGEWDLKWVLFLISCFLSLQFLRLSFYCF